MLRVILLVAIVSMSLVLVTGSSRVELVPSTHASTFQPHTSILIIGNSAFTQSNGVLKGTGASNDPYVIQGWQINGSQENGISIFNVTNYFVIQAVSIYSGIHGIFMQNVTNGAVQDSVFSNNEMSIFISHSKNIVISQNTISKSTQTYAGAGDSGIRCDYCTALSILSNNISSTLFDQTPGIILNSSPGPVVSGNTIWWSDYAISLNNTAHAIVTGNNASYNAGTGLILAYSPKTNVTANHFDHNQNGVLMDLLALDTSPSIYFAGNDVEWNEAGIKVASPNSTISNNTVAYNGYGIQVGENTTISRNTITSNAGNGLVCCPNVAAIRGNTIVNDGLDYSNDPYAYVRHPTISLTITPDNLINGKPLYFYAGRSNVNVSGTPIGQLILLNCNNIRVSGVAITETSVGLQIVNSNNTIITASSFNSNTVSGISLVNFRNATFIGNNISNNGDGPASSGFGVETKTGIYESPANPSVQAVVAYHNNFFYDTVVGENYHDVWDNGYPSGGNFYTDYTGVDKCSGPLQNLCPSPDGIGDARFGVDRYPLMTPYLATPDTIAPTWLPGTQLNVTGVTETSVSLYWIRAADDVAVMNYLVYQGPSIIGNVSAASLIQDGPIFFSEYTLTVANLSPGTGYTFRIVAVDVAGNRGSGPSAAVTTLPSPPGTPGSVIGSWLLQYGYVIVLGGGVAVAALLFWLGIQSSRRRAVVHPTGDAAPVTQQSM